MGPVHIRKARLLLLLHNFPVCAHQGQCQNNSSERKALFQTNFEEEKKGPGDNQRGHRQGAARLLIILKDWTSSNYSSSESLWLLTCSFLAVALAQKYMYMYVLQLRLRVIPVPNSPSTSERNVACISEPQAIFTRKMNNTRTMLLISN